MSNRDDFPDFDDPFGDFGDFDDNSGDSTAAGGDADDFGFPGDWGDAESNESEDVLRSMLGDEGEYNPDFDDEDNFDLEDDGDERRTIFGMNRAFVIILGIIMALVCVGVIAVLAITLSGQFGGPSDVELSLTAIYATNTYVAYALELTETQNANNANLTATATMWTATPSATPTSTPTYTPSPTEVVPTQVSIFVTPTPDPSNVLDPSGVAGTATALAQLIIASPTPEVGTGDTGGTDGTGEGTGGTGGGFITPTPVSALPETGLFDDAFANGQGVNGLLMAGLAVLGLAGVIVVARTLRKQ